MAKVIEAVLDKVVAKIINDDRQTEGGIVIPDSVVNLPQLTCDVVSVGNEVECVKVHDTIYCHRNAGMDILVDGVPMKVLADKEIYAKITGDSNDSAIPAPPEEPKAPGIRDIVENK